MEEANTKATIIWKKYRDEGKNKCRLLKSIVELIESEYKLLRGSIISILYKTMVTETI